MSFISKIKYKNIKTFNGFSLKAFGLYLKSKNNINSNIRIIKSLNKTYRRFVFSDTLFYQIKITYATTILIYIYVYIYNRSSSLWPPRNSDASYKEETLWLRGMQREISGRVRVEQNESLQYAKSFASCYIIVCTRVFIVLPKRKC